MVLVRVRPTFHAVVAFGLAALLTVGCAEGPVYDPSAVIPPVTVPAEPLAYSPLLPRLPIAAGIYYSPEWRLAEMTGWASGDPRVRFKLGLAAVAYFDQIAAALFERVEPLPSWPANGPGMQVVDLVMVPRIEQSEDAFIGFTVGVDVFSPNGSLITSVATKPWYIPETDQHDSQIPADSARIAQIRLKETLAALSTSLIFSEELEHWAQTRGLIWRWPEAEQGTVTGIKASGLTIVQRKKQRNFRASAESVAVGEALKKLDPQLLVVPTYQLVDALYPWLSSAGLDDAVLIEQLRHPAIVDRANRSGVRYIVVARILETWNEEHGGIAPLGGPGGAGFFGLMWWSRQEAGDLHVLDLTAAGETRAVSHRRDVPTFALPAFILPVPIPLPAAGESMPEAIAKQLLPLVRPAP